MATLTLKPKTNPTTLKTGEVPVLSGNRLATQPAKPPARPPMKGKPKAKPTPPKKPALRTKKPRVQVPRTKPAPTLVKSKELLARLVEDHPVLFAMEGPATPWVVGIDHQIQHLYRVSNRVAKLVLSTWMATRGVAYRQAMEEGKPAMGLPSICE